MASELTPYQEAYCQHVANGFSYADAYRMSYNPRADRTNFYTDIWALNKHPQIFRRVQELKAASTEKLGVTRDWLLRWWWLRMIYDPAEITSWAHTACRYCHGDGHNYQWREHEFIEAIAQAEATKTPFPDCSGGFGYNTTHGPHADCPACDGKGVGRENFTDTTQLSEAARAGFEGIKRTREGIEIKMADRDKAAEQFAKLSGWDVVQIRHVTDIPDPPELEQLAGDPLALAALYKRLMAPGAGSRH